jgi:hypothetical protein
MIVITHGAAGKKAAVWGIPYHPGGMAICSALFSCITSCSFGRMIRPYSVTCTSILDGYTSFWQKYCFRFGYPTAVLRAMG